MVEQLVFNSCDIDIFGINVVGVKEVEDTGGRVDGSYRSLWDFGQMNTSMGGGFPVELTRSIKCASPTSSREVMNRLQRLTRACSCSSDSMAVLNGGFGILEIL